MNPIKIEFTWTFLRLKQKLSEKNDESWKKNNHMYNLHYFPCMVNCATNKILKVIEGNCIYKINDIYKQVVKSDYCREHFSFNYLRERCSIKE